MSGNFQTDNLDLIDKKLRQKEQWLNWVEEMRNGEMTKIPLDPNGDHSSGRDHASTRDEDTWGAMMSAVASYNKNGDISGIGFVFKADGPFLGIDLDDCRDPETGEWDDWALDVLQTVDGFKEISPSGTGAHILLIGDKPGSRNKKGGCEMYEEGRYFTVTADVIDSSGERTDSPAAVVEDQNGIDEVYEMHIGTDGEDEDGETVDVSEIDTSTNRSKKTDTSQSGGGDIESLPEDLKDIVLDAKTAGGGYKFKLLWEGDWKKYRQYANSSTRPSEWSQSEADLAFCDRLAFWTDGDEEAMDTIFRASGLMRQKWDETRYSDGSTYGEGTIAEALSQVSETRNSDDPSNDTDPDRDSSSENGSDSAATNPVGTASSESNGTEGNKDGGEGEDTSPTNKATAEQDSEPIQASTNGAEQKSGGQSKGNSESEEAKDSTTTKTDNVDKSASRDRSPSSITDSLITDENDEQNSETDQQGSTDPSTDNASSASVVANPEITESDTSEADNEVDSNPSEASEHGSEDVDADVDEADDLSRDREESGGFDDYNPLGSGDSETSSVGIESKDSPDSADEESSTDSSANGSANSIDSLAHEHDLDGNIEDISPDDVDAGDEVVESPTDSEASANSETDSIENDQPSQDESEPTSTNAETKETESLGEDQGWEDKVEVDYEPFNTEDRKMETEAGKRISNIEDNIDRIIEELERVHEHSNNSLQVVNDNLATLQDEVRVFGQELEQCKDRVDQLELLILRMLSEKPDPPAEEIAKQLGRGGSYNGDTRAAKVADDLSFSDVPEQMEMESSPDVDTKPVVDESDSAQQTDPVQQAESQSSADERVVDIDTVENDNTDETPIETRESRSNRTNNSGDSDDEDDGSGGIVSSLF